MTFEIKLKRIEEIVKNMEGGDISLDQSLQLFEEGVKLSRECQSELTAAEQKIQQLVKVGADGTPTTKEFRAE
ncbi:MAG: exodeoxyribonuclease VII small subunit [Bdellovibrionales bacterium]